MHFEGLAVDDLRSVASDVMHSPVSIRVQCTTLAHAFHTDSHVSLHRPARCPSMLGYCWNTRFNIGTLHKTLRLMQLTLSDVKNHIGPTWHALSLRKVCIRVHGN